MGPGRWTVEAVSRVIDPLAAPVRRLYDWVLSWAEHPAAPWALFLLAFCEASFFPIPPDCLLMALAISRPRSAFLYGGICLAGSVAGGAFGYLLGSLFMETAGRWIIQLYHLQAQYAQVTQLYQRYGVWAVATGGFTPLPYKLFTVTAGAFGMAFVPFLMASALSRGGRFLLEALLFYLFGPPIKAVIERYFGLFTVIFMVLLIGGFVVIRWMV